MAETHDGPKLPESQDANERKDDMKIEREHTGNDSSEDVEREPAGAGDERTGRMANRTSVRHRESTDEEAA